MKSELKLAIGMKNWLKNEEKRSKTDLELQLLQDKTNHTAVRLRALNSDRISDQNCDPDNELQN